MPIGEMMKRYRCQRCGRLGHSTAECFAKTHFKGMPLPNAPNASGSESEGDDHKDMVVVHCIRCGRFGHAVGDCFANVDVQGRPIKKAARGEGAVAADSFPSAAGGAAVPAPLPAAAGAPPSGVYVLLLENDMWYVGKSANVAERVAQHFSGQGAVCAKGPIGTILPSTPRMEDLESWERVETLELMVRRGISKVRGWKFTNTVMSERERERAFEEICERKDLCRRCGGEGHFADRCTATSKAGWAGR